MTKLTEYIDARRMAQLPDGTPAEKIDAMLDRPDAREYIQAVDAPVLYQLIRDAGWDQAQELMGYVSTEQLQTFVDLDCWTRDRFSTSKLAPWFAAIVAEADDATFRKHCRETDPEVLAMFFKDNLQVDIWNEEREIPEQFLGENVESSPDRVYAIVYPEDQDVGALLREAIDRLYTVDMVLAWTLLEAVRWELMSAMEFEAYRWRNSRLEEYGFVDADEALAIYKPLDPARFRERIESEEFEAKLVGDLQNLPVVPEAAVDERFYAAAMIERLEGDDLEHVMAEFIALQNRAVAAEGTPPGQSSAVVVAERTTGYLSIGLEFLSRRDDERATELLTTVSVRDIFRAGFTIVDRLRDNVARIRRRPTLTLVEGERFSLLRDDDAALCDALLRPRPLYAAELSDEGDGQPEIFTTQEQVDRAAMRLGLIAFKQLWLFGVQRVAPGELVQRAYGELWLNGPPEVTFDAFFTTELAQVLVGREPDTLGLRVSDLEALPPLLADEPWGDDPIAFFEDVVGPVLEQLPTGARLVTRWLESQLAELVDELAPVHDIENPELFTGVLVLQRDGFEA